VGVSAAIAWLAPSAVGSSPPVVGTGTVDIAHGVVPVPAPATSALLRGIPIVAEGFGELTTPTGAAILATVVDSFGSAPPMVIRSVGYGAGTRELTDRPNVLRATIGEPIGEMIGQGDSGTSSSVFLMESNVDDMNPELVAPLYEALIAAGAVDVWSVPILMKKGRPALQVAALAPGTVVTAVERAFFRNSTTLGLRVRAVDRVVLARSVATVQTRYGRLGVKLAALDGEVIGAHPEFDDCRRLAAKAGVPVRAVMASAVAESQRFLEAAAGRRKPRPSSRKRSS
jgi:pyridinium-3,5-bisthiocarboxylic acid mononucleotide nickel chelatase